MYGHFYLDFRMDDHAIALNVRPDNVTQFCIRTVLTPKSFISQTIIFFYIISLVFTAYSSKSSIHKYYQLKDYLTLNSIVIMNSGEITCQRFLYIKNRSYTALFLSA